MEQLRIEPNQKRKQLTIRLPLYLLLNLEEYCKRTRQKKTRIIEDLVKQKLYNDLELINQELKLAKFKVNALEAQRNALLIKREKK